MKVLLVDDEPLARERLIRLLKKTHPDVIPLQAENGVDALAIVEAHAPDLLLLDIRMPGMDGIEVAMHLQQLDEPPAIIFCTAYDQYALAALQHEAVAYLLKPVREKELSAALERAGRVNRLQLAALREDDDRRSRVSSQTHRGLETLSMEDIRCFIADHKYVTATSPDKELVLPDTLRDLESEFPGDFIRIHRNALVAIAHIRQLLRDDEGGWYLELEGVEQCPSVSRRHLPEVKALLLNRA
ncbi:MAG: LytTR family DNA-binding domain-containing protein [Halioglobus sp.]